MALMYELVSFISLGVYPDKLMIHWCIRLERPCASMHAPSHTHPFAMSEVTFTFRVDPSLKSEFSAAAKCQDRNEAQLLQEFMRDFVRQQQGTTDNDAWFRRQVQMGLDAANAGDLIPSEQLEAEAAQWRTQMRRSLAGSAL
jgi:predicted transcriptional regulator